MRCLAVRFYVDFLCTIGLTSLPCLYHALIVLEIIVLLSDSEPLHAITTADTQYVLPDVEESLPLIAVLHLF